MAVKEAGVEVRSMAELRGQVFQEDNHPTTSSAEQIAVEKSCLAAYELYHKAQWFTIEFSGKITYVSLI